MAIGTYIPIITLNVNVLNASSKRHRLPKWIQKQGPYICCLQETRLRLQDTYRLKVRGWKNIFHANGKQKKGGVAILISDKIELKMKITRNKEGHCIMIKGSTQEEDITIVKYLCTQHRSTSIQKTNTNRHKRRNWQWHNNNRRLYHPTHTNGQIIKTED